MRHIEYPCAENCRRLDTAEEREDLDPTARQRYETVDSLCLVLELAHEHPVERSHQRIWEHYASVIGKRVASNNVDCGVWSHDTTEMKHLR